MDNHGVKSCRNHYNEMADKSVIRVSSIKISSLGLYNISSPFPCVWWWTKSCQGKRFRYEYNVLNTFYYRWTDNSFWISTSWSSSLIFSTFISPRQLCVPLESESSPRFNYNDHYQACLKRFISSMCLLSSITLACKYHVTKIRAYYSSGSSRYPKSLV